MNEKKDPDVDSFQLPAGKKKSESGERKSGAASPAGEVRRRNPWSLNEGTPSKAPGAGVTDAAGGIEKLTRLDNNMKNKGFNRGVSDGVPPVGSLRPSKPGSQRPS